MPENGQIGILQTSGNRSVSILFNIRLAAIIVCTCDAACPRRDILHAARPFRDFVVLQ